MLDARNGCPDGKLEPKDKVYCQCTLCSEDIYHGDEAYDISGETLCRECALIFLDQHKFIAGEE